MEMKLRRSSRSRSKTPFSFSSTNELIEDENHRDITMRQTRSTTVKTTKITSSNDSELFGSYSINNKSKSDKNGRKGRYKTSDYSSEDGEQQVSSSLTTDQNMTNQFLEDSRRSISRASESSHTSALDIYRAAGDYWNKFPKTDYTYSRHSKDRKEISPGVVAMPNMSRKSLHSDSSLDEYTMTDKEVNTASEVHYTPTSALFSENYIRSRFTNIYNNHNDNYNSVRSSRRLIIKEETFFTRVYTKLKTTIVTIITLILSFFQVIFQQQKSALIWFGKKIHKGISRVMLADTQILKRSNTNKKLKFLLALCLIPLLFFAGWWLLFGTVPLIYGTYANVTESIIQTLPFVSTSDAVRTNSDDNFDSNQDLSTIKELNAKLTSDQVEEIVSLLKNSLDKQYNEKLIIQKILQDENMQNVINNYNKFTVQLKEINSQKRVSNDDELKSQHLINEKLQEEIKKLRDELSNLHENRNDEFLTTVAQLRNENLQHNTRIANQLKRCCRNNFIQIESYVTKLLKDILGAPNYLSSHKDISDWLHATFVAKETLEERLVNLTQNLKSDYQVLMENNGKVIMDQVMKKISLELNNRINQINNQKFGGLNNINVDSLTDEYVKKIVKDALAVYDADKTGLVDYALESGGGQILSTRCTESYNLRTTVISLFGIPLWFPSNNPRTAIKPGVTPGECWAFQNFPGFLLIKLAFPIRVEAFSLEHISKSLSPYGRIDSAPKEFSVYGLRNETDSDPVLLGQYEYEENGPSLQYFAAAIHDLVLSIVELRIFSNHGNPNYTCLYRFRVHGHLVTEST